MTFLLRRCRLLPMTALVASIFLTIKVSAIWQDLGAGLSGRLSVTQAQAAASGTANKPEREAAAAASKAMPATPPEKAHATAGDNAPTPTAAAESPDPRVRDAGGFTASELEVLQQLARRRDALAQRVEDVERRESLLKAAELRIEEKLTELNALKGEMERLVRAHNQEQEAQTQSLVKIYENMKPKDAARIFDELELETLVPVAHRMKERKLAPVLAEVKPARVKEITEELARAREAAGPALDVPQPSSAAPR